jgi:homopolymeric O-antigen transport system ATP-binding protein
MVPVIEVNHLSKKYELGASRPREDSLREVLMHSLRRSWQTLRRGSSASQNASGPQWIWALRDVNFSVEPGDVVGIIGANGAGKSTLLKILSRITDPTEGYVRLRGRVASLLEVGTGFHPDLTGRENIFLNGVMLGMTKAEVLSKFDEIVAFSELEKFLDTPVKHYSSGMYVRLGFAVAAHLDPEILIVDEVLAVGDMAFQKKCLGKMGEFGESGRTILFVSHNIAAMVNLCQKGIVLQQGQLTFEGDAKSAANYYVGAVSGEEKKNRSHTTDLWSARGRLPQFRPWLCKLELYNGEAIPFDGEMAIGGTLRVHLQFLLHQPSANFDARINFVDMYGQVIFAARSTYDRDRNWGERSGQQEMICEIHDLPLTPGEYRIVAALVIDEKCVDYVENAGHLKIVGSDFYGTGKIPSLGFFVHKQSWHLK